MSGAGSVTVGELRRALQGLPDRYPVVLQMRSHDEYGPTADEGWLAAVFVDADPDIDSDADAVYLAAERVKTVGGSLADRPPLPGEATLSIFAAPSRRKHKEAMRKARDRLLVRCQQAGGAP